MVLMTAVSKQFTNVYLFSDRPSDYHPHFTAGKQKNREVQWFWVPNLRLQDLICRGTYHYVILQIFRAELPLSPAAAVSAQHFSRLDPGVPSQVTV